MHEFKKGLNSTYLSHSILDFLASKTDFVIEEIPGRVRAWAVRETNLRLDQPNRDGNGNQVHRDMNVEDGELVLVQKCSGQLGPPLLLAKLFQP